MNRLWVRLVVAFGLVAAVAVAAIALLLSWQADTHFRRYVTQSGFTRQGGLAEGLEARYRENQSWEGVETLLDAAVPAQGPMGRGRNPLAGGRFSLRLADADGWVIYGERAGQLTEGQMAGAVSIVVDGVTVGYLTSTAPRPDVLGPLEQGFLAQFRSSLLVGAAAAGILGLLLGLLLSRSLTAPLRRLTAATKAVASGDFSQSIEESGSAELVEVARSFNEMTSALLDAEIHRKNLISDVAHELRTPLTVLQGNLQAILDEVYPLERGEIAHLYDETRLLNRLVEDLRELALAEAGELRLDLQPTDAAQAIRRIASAFALVAEDGGIELTVSEAEGLPSVLADPDRLVQVLSNLVSNGLRHTPAGGRVSISTEVAGDMLEIDISDTGDGLSADDLSHVFDRFWRADRSRARETGGSGLGLTITKQLVQAQGGTIGVESAPGLGSRFWFRLRIAKDSL
ncbi:MAG TPA: ATP-binding protein [Anaerolineae bacterium]|nr:ATP-binding protein [Anaerolineae bacterium]